MWETSVEDPNYIQKQKEKRQAERERVERGIFASLCFATGTVLVVMTMIVFLFAHQEIFEVVKSGDMLLLMVPCLSISLFAYGVYGMKKYKVVAHNT